VVDSINGKDSVESVLVKNKKTQEMREIKISALFVAIGIIPQSDDVKDIVKTDSAGYIVTDGSMKTSLPGVFAAGDIVVKTLRQVVTAAADGAIAIYSVQSYLREKQ
jgi:thioredoxin reductase (NADPH)